MNKIKILVINIALRPGFARKILPIGMGYITAAIRRAGFEFDMLDLDAHPRSQEQTEKFLRMNQYDVVAMGCIVTGYKYVKWLSLIIKEAFPDTTVIVGNTVAQSIPNILLSKTGADVAVMGEGDEAIVDLLHRLESSRDMEGIAGICYKKDGHIVANPPRPLIEDIDLIPMPDWTSFDLEIYIKSLSESVGDPLPPIPKEKIRAKPINTARGCPFNCTFCYHVFRGEKYRWRSAESIVQEMQRDHDTYGINYFVFADELTFFSLKQAEHFANSIIASGLQVYWAADVRSGLFTNEEHIQIAIKLKKAGCLYLGYALESANPDILKWMDKKVGPEAFSRQVDILRRGGITSFTSIVLGYPNETEKTITETIDCCIANKIYPSSGYLLPQPGSPMYDFAVKSGHIIDEEDYLLAMGDRQDLRVNMTSMTDEVFTAIVERELGRCSRELGINLPEGALLKTGSYRTSKAKS
ncbi:MAG: radical SAM protein [Deltaproteobacteria bacterium]|nr:radical SAM protein [Deltaproteobacteria bacterium]